MALAITIPSYGGVTFYGLPSSLVFTRGITEGPDGYIYGASQGGGANHVGAIWKMSPSGQFTLLVSFDGGNGANPFVGVTYAGGNFYGVTEFGGANGTGTIFEMTPAGAITTLFSFDGAANGMFPKCKLVAGGDGYLYGSTDDGYASDRGNIFKISLDGAFSPVTSPGGAKGLVKAADGNFYGVDDGSVFRLSSDGTRTELASFPWGLSAPIIGFDGNLYGTTYFGGTHDGGTVWKCTTAGDFSVLFDFDSFVGFGQPSATGGLPQFGVTQGNDGNFYGTTGLGGGNGYGNAFELTPAGQLSPIFSFTTSNSACPLILASDGNIYGASSDPGLSGSGMNIASLSAKAGAVFRIQTGTLRPVAAGNYNGLFAETNSSGDTVVNVASAGMVRGLSVKKTGTFTGRILLAGGNYSLTGAFKTDGTATATLGGPIGVAMTMDAAHGIISGTVSNLDGSWVSSLRAKRNIGQTASARFTMLIPTADPTGVTSPSGAGYETVNNDHGIVSFTGAVADGAAASMNTVPLTVDGDVPFYASLYKGAGLLHGWIGLSSGTPTGTLSWIAGANASKCYPAGFTNRNLQVSSSPWIKPSPAVPPIAITNGTLTVSGGGLTSPLTFVVTGAVPKGDCLSVSSSNNSDTLHAAINLSTGALTLNIKPPGKGKLITAHGAVLQNSTTAGGASMQPTNQAGAFTLSP